MAGLVPAIHAFARAQDVDARHKAGHDEARMQSPSPLPAGRTMSLHRHAPPSPAPSLLGRQRQSQMRCHGRA
jgi:hypothetical protein